MSYYGNRTGTERRTRTPRKDSVDSTNTNGNNNNDVSKGVESYITNYTRRRTELAQRTSLNRNPGGPRTKSNLVGSMTATFEQLNKGSLPPPGVSSIKSSSCNRVENATTIDQKTTNSPKLENGTAANHTTRSTNAPKLENGMAKCNVDDEDAERTPAHAKSGSSARRGKQQREKRMLRQKRRSTGVVRLKESDDEEEKGAGKKGGNDPNVEKDEETTTGKSETEKNTLSNEFSPPPSANSTKTESERARTYEATEGTTPISKITLKPPTASSPITSPHPNDNVFTSGDSTSQSPTMPVLNSSRRRGNKSSYERSRQESNEKREIDELREKLATAELTITKLSKEVGDMETDIQHFAQQNHDLKKQNKMLEDENSSMLMVLKQLRNSTA